MPAAKVDEEAVAYEEKRPAASTGSSSDENVGAQHAESTGRKASVAAMLRNPLTGMSESDVLADVDLFVETRGLQEHREIFHKGGMMARAGNTPSGYEQLNILTNEEKDYLRHEDAHRWSQPFMLYFLVVLCAGSAIVQGMDQTAVNGAQVCAESLRLLHLLIA